jgi:hypothetical protein
LASFNFACEYCDLAVFTDVQPRGKSRRPAAETAPAAAPASTTTLSTCRGRRFLFLGRKGLGDCDHQSRPKHRQHFAPGHAKVEIDAIHRLVVGQSVWVGQGSNRYSV